MNEVPNSPEPNQPDQAGMAKPDVNEQQSKIDERLDSYPEDWFELDTPQQFTDLARALGKEDDQFLSLLLSSSIAIGMNVYYFGDDFWWKIYADNPEVRTVSIRDEFKAATSLAMRIETIMKVVPEIEERYRVENDNIFILIDLNSATAFADLPDVMDTMLIGDEFLPNATFYKGNRQIKGFRSGKTAYSVGFSELAPRSSCLRSAFKDASAVLDSERQIVANGLTLRAVKEMTGMVVVTGVLETKLPMDGVYNDQNNSPQEYILKVMYGLFSNEPVVALENEESN